LVTVFFKGYGQWLGMFCTDGQKHINSLSSKYLANGIFQLTEADELTYNHTKQLKKISTLLPSSHSDDEFSKIISNGKAFPAFEGYAFFEIDGNFQSSCRLDG
jgi:hypothetical protein